MESGDSQPLLTFGDTAIKYQAATQHFAVIGATGSGKTVLIRLLMQSVIGLATKRNVPTRMLVYDSKRDMYPVLTGIFNALGVDKAEEEIILLNPFDKRSYAWDLAADITEPAHAQEFASIIIQEKPEAKDTFFPDAARLILESVVLSFIEESPLEWDLRDVCCAVETKENIEAVLNRSGRTSWVVQSLFGEPKTTANILSTLAVSMRPYRVIAALWHKAVQRDPKKKISLHNWLRNNKGIFVLGNSPTSRTAVDAINQVLFKRLSQIILEEEKELSGKDDYRRVWMILDEFVRAGKLNGAVELATEGRSKGVALVVGFQDINGIRAVYGKEVAEEILGQCSSIALLRMNSPDTADWASRIVGEYRAKDRAVTATEGLQSGEKEQLSSGTSVAEQIVDRRSLLPSHFQRIRPVSERSGLGGVFCSPYWEDESSEEVIDATGNEPIPYDWLFTEQNLWPKSDNTNGFDRVEGKDQFLTEWRDKDFGRLNISAQPPEEPKETGGIRALIEQQVQTEGVCKINWSTKPQT